MPLDKKLYRQTYQQYQTWNEAKKAGHLHNTPLLPAEAWRRYVELVEFCWRLADEPSPQQREQRLADWDIYYARLQQFEEGRRARGKTT